MIAAGWLAGWRVCMYARERACVRARRGGESGGDLGKNVGGERSSVVETMTLTATCDAEEEDDDDEACEAAAILDVAPLETTM